MKTLILAAGAALVACTLCTAGAAEDSAELFVRLGRPLTWEWRHAFPEPAQSFDQYCFDMGRALPFEERRISLMPLGESMASDREVLDKIRTVLSAYYMTMVDIEPRREIPAAVARRTSRGFGIQYDAGDIIGELSRDHATGTVARLCVTQEDLYGEYMPGRTMSYAFGMGSGLERTGVISLARFRMRYPSQSPNADKVRRAVKVAVHETGHIFGIMHCTRYACAMNGSAMMAEADNRPMHLCPDCIRKLRWHFGIDQSLRYLVLSKAYTELGWLEDAAFAARMADSASSRGFPREHVVSFVTGTSR